MDLRARLQQALGPIPPGSLVPRDWVVGIVEEAGDDDDDLTAAEFGRLRNRAESTVRTWCAQGRLPGAYRLNGREWRIPRSALRALRDQAHQETDGREGEEDDAVELGGWREEVP